MCSICFYLERIDGENVCALDREEDCDDCPVYLSREDGMEMLGDIVYHETREA